MNMPTPELLFYIFPLFFPLKYEKGGRHPTSTTHSTIKGNKKVSHQIMDMFVVSEC